MTAAHFPGRRHDDACDIDEEQLGKRERNKLEKRRRIAAAATELFQERGFADTTTAEIAARADVGAGTLYLYVDSKEDLLVGTFLDLAGARWFEALDAVDPDDTLVDQLMAVFASLAEYHNGDRRLTRAFFKELPYVGDVAGEAMDAFHRWLLDRLEAILLTATERGKLVAGVPTATMAHNLYSLWQIVMRRVVAERVVLDDAIELLERSVRTALFGMTPET